MNTTISDLTLDQESLLTAAIYILGVFLTTFTLYYAWEHPVTRLRFSNVFLGVGLALFYLLQVRSYVSGESPGATVTETVEPASVRPSFYEQVIEKMTFSWETVVQRVDPIYCLFLAGISAAVAGYVEYHFDRLLMDAPVVGWTQVDLFVGLVIIYLVIDSTKRAFGVTIAGVIAVSVVYALVGPWLPGILQHTGMSWEQISREGAIGFDGVYGFILGVGVTWVAVFIMFAGIAKVYGLMDFIVDVSGEVRKTFRSGVVHIAVLGSMAMGSITGSAAANTATTGSFTIPMMKDQGVREDFSAAIEAVASSGGQMMPPVMGVAAFLMADILGVPYLTIIQAGLLPAALFYLSVLVAVQLALLKFEWTVPAEGKFDRSVFLSGIHFVVPIFVLIYTLVVMRLTPLGAGLYTIISLILVMYVRNAIMDGASLGTVLDTTKQTIVGLKQGAVEMAPLVGMLGALGVVLNMLTQTGLSQKISTQMITLAAGIFIFLLILSMVTSILFGLGMPTPAAYILVVILVAPSMIGFGVRDITAHMFVFYFAMLSAITPPVAVSVAIGSQIAGSNFLIACKQALRVGAPGFVIPFSFIFNESLIYWSFPETPIAMVLVFVAVVALTVATIGYNGKDSISFPRRGGYLVLSAIGMWGPFVAQIGAVVLILSLLTFANIQSRTGTSTLSND